jgi:hypothetical protein
LSLGWFGQKKMVNYCSILFSLSGELNYGKHVILACGKHMILTDDSASFAHISTGSPLQIERN